MKKEDKRVKECLTKACKSLDLLRLLLLAKKKGHPDLQTRPGWPTICSGWPTTQALECLDSPTLWSLTKRAQHNRPVRIGRTCPSCSTQARGFVDPLGLVGQFAF